MNVVGVGDNKPAVAAVDEWDTADIHYLSTEWRNFGNHRIEPGDVKSQKDRIRIGDFRMDRFSVGDLELGEVNLRSLLRHRNHSLGVGHSFETAGILR